jgi:hypothetical protein
MKLSFSTLGCPNCSFDEIALRASQYGYDGVAFRGLGGELDLTRVPEFFPAALANTRHRLKEAGLGFEWTVATGRAWLPAVHLDRSLISMALILQVDDEGRVRPKIRCDACGKVIESHSGATAVWDSQSTKPGAVLEPTFQCEHCKPKAGGTPSLPIDHFMLYLLNNIQLTPRVLEEAGRRLTID